MCVSKGGVDLNGTCVALQCPLHVLHLLQGVAHVGVGIRKGRTDPGSHQQMEIQLHSQSHTQHYSAYFFRNEPVLLQQLQRGRLEQQHKCFI